MFMVEWHQSLARKTRDHRRELRFETFLQEVQGKAVDPMHWVSRGVRMSQVDGLVGTPKLQNPRRPL